MNKITLKNLSLYLDKDFDIIIDDGSHNIKDQAITINALFNNLKKGGIYVIEDISQYMYTNKLNPDNLSYGVKEILLSIKNLNYENLKYIDYKDAANIGNKFKSVSFEKGNFKLNNINMSEIVFIEKI